jgi:hypothetical protein
MNSREQVLEGLKKEKRDYGAEEINQRREEMEGRGEVETSRAEKYYLQYYSVPGSFTGDAARSGSPKVVQTAITVPP